MKYSIKYTPLARENLVEIYDYIAQVSLEGARNQLERIQQNIMERLSFMPGGIDYDDRLGRKLNQAYKTQGIIIDKYIVLFVVDDEEHDVIITHVVPSKSDYMRVLK